MDYEDQMLLKSSAYEQMVNSQGWEALRKWANEQIDNFTNQAVITGFQTLEEYQFFRGRIAGLKDLLNEVESNLESLRRWREENKQ